MPTSVYYRGLMGYSTFTLQWVEGKQVINIPLKTTKIAELVKHMTSKHEVVGLNQGSNFFQKNIHLISLKSHLKGHLECQATMMQS